MGLSSRKRSTSGASFSRMRLSPRYMQKESVPDEGLGDQDGMREPERRLLLDIGDRTPKRLPSPTASRISWCVSPTTMPISLIPEAARASMP